MNCPFCDKRTSFSHLENVESKEIRVNECLNCQVPILFHIDLEDGTLMKTVFIIDKNQRVYLWTNDHVNNCSYIAHAKIDETNIHDSYIARFPNILNIHPDKILSKFSLYIVFS